MDTKERIKGAFIGMIFGSGVNPRFSPMLTPEEARKRFGNKKFGEYFDYEIYGKLYQLYDQYTMSKIVLDILYEYGKITPEVFRDYLLDLHKKYDVFKGDVYGPSVQRAVTKILEKANIFTMGQQGVTCGAAMRGIPIALYFYNDKNKIIEETINSCIISHSTDVAVDAALAVNLNLYYLINGRDKFNAIEETIKELRNIHRNYEKFSVYGKYVVSVEDKETLDKILEYRRDLPRDIKIPRIHELIDMVYKDLKNKTIDEAMFYIPEKIGVGWYAWQTIPGAFANYIVSDSPEEVSLLSMRCGGDNQTVPEIACSFLGALEGSEIFSKEILKKIEKTNSININELMNKIIRE